jgi:Tfp pilus assembly protein PilE
MAKMLLRGVNFSCSLIVLAMLSTVLTIFHATKAIPKRNNLPPWAPNTPLWPQIVVLSIACVSLLFAVVVMLAYCRGGHHRAEKVAVYYTMFAVGWFMFSVVMWLVGAGILHGSKANGGGSDLWGWSCKDNKRKQLFQDDVHYALICRLQDWSLICCIIEVIVEVIVIAIYAIVFYRFYSKNRLRKSMDARDRARIDLYLAQRRSQSAPNTPGFAQTPRAAAFPSANTPRTPGFPTLSKSQEAGDDSPTQLVAATPQSNHTSSPFKLQAPPIRVHHATPRADQDGFERVTHSPPLPSMSPPPQERINDHVSAAPGEQQYDAVPIPGAYAGQYQGNAH